jgi:hypothetical protein
MRNEARRSVSLRAGVLAASILLSGSRARAQLLSGTSDVNVTKMSEDQSECTISKNPTNLLQVFVSCNNLDGRGLFAAWSVDGGVTWKYTDDKTIADGDPVEVPVAFSDPSSAWDAFGNLYLTYLDSMYKEVVTLLSKDGGKTFSLLARFPGSSDQPTVVATRTRNPPVPVAVWIIWNLSGKVVARGAEATGPGDIRRFGKLQTIAESSRICGFADITIAANGAVVQACLSPTGGEGPAKIFVSRDPDGLGPKDFGTLGEAATTNVGGVDHIPPQYGHSVGAEVGVAFDNSASPRRGRLYLVYTEETVDESGDTNIMLRFSDPNDRMWSSPIRVNDDRGTNSQFLPKLAIDDSSGSIVVCWHDCRNSESNKAVQIYCADASPADPVPNFVGRNVMISEAASTSSGAGFEFGDYSGLDYFGGVAHPVWADASKRGKEPNGVKEFDALTDRVTGTKQPDN